CSSDLRFLLLAVLFSCTGLIAQPISVSTNTYTVPQLVEEVLFGSAGAGSSCAGTISNISWSTGTNFGCGDNGIGYFTNSNPNFPMSSGVVLSTGSASNAPGPNSGTLSDGGGCGWGGDSQLFNYIQGLGIDPGLG